MWQSLWTITMQMQIWNKTKEAAAWQNRDRWLLCVCVCMWTTMCVCACHREGGRGAAGSKHHRVCRLPVDVVEGNKWEGLVGQKSMGQIVWVVCLNQSYSCPVVLWCCSGEARGGRSRMSGRCRARVNGCTGEVTSYILYTVLVSRGFYARSPTKIQSCPMTFTHQNKVNRPSQLLWLCKHNLFVEYKCVRNSKNNVTK